MTREEIIDGLEIYTVGRLNKAIVYITVEELQKFIDEIKALEKETPSASTEKTGRWNSYRNEKGDWINECSVCEQDSGVLYPYNFCPNCGAKMEV